MKLRILICLIIFLGMGNITYAQKSSSLKPKWINNPPVANSNSGFYFIETHADAATSLEGAREIAIKELTSNVERTDKVTISEIYTDKSSQTYQGRKVNYNGSDTYELNLKVEGVSRPITSRRIDEYWKTEKRGGQKVVNYYALYAVGKQNEKADFSNIRVTSSYGARGLWRSAIIPGWGQFYKGSNLKGGLILGGSVALAGGIVFLENQRADYVRKINQTKDINLIKKYQTKRDHYASGRNICIGVLAGLYVYNLIDAIVAPGAKRIVMGKIGSNSNYSFLPDMNLEGTPMMTATLTF